MLYTDTIHLKPGVYEFELTDEGGDGLEFWAEPQQGYGYLRFLDTEGNILHHFISDCGNGQFLAFKATPEAKLDSTVSQNAFFIIRDAQETNWNWMPFSRIPKNCACSSLQTEFPSKRTNIPISNRVHSNTISVICRKEGMLWKSMSTTYWFTKTESIAINHNKFKTK